MIEVLTGDCIELMRTLPERSVHTCVTSPPYFGLRNYGHDGQIGLEPTPDVYVARLVEVFREVRRVLRDDGTLWLNLGDSYASTAPGTKNAPQTKGSKVNADQWANIRPDLRAHGLKPKDLIGIPWRVAFALQADGWYLRQDIIWHKPNPMPESVTDRCTKAHEYIFMLSKGPKYFFDAEAIKEPATWTRNNNPDWQKQRAATNVKKGAGNRNAVDGGFTGWDSSKGRNRRSVWTVTTKPFKGAHFATFPPDLIEPCILAGAPERCCSVCGAGFIRQVEKGEVDLEWQRRCGGDASGGYSGESTKDYASAGAQDASATKRRILEGMRPKITVGWSPACGCNAVAAASRVLDPFGGSGTTGLVAAKHGRRAVLCELNPRYADMARERVGLPTIGPTTAQLNEIEGLL